MTTTLATRPVETRSDDVDWYAAEALARRLGWITAWMVAQRYPPVVAKWATERAFEYERGGPGNAQQVATYLELAELCGGAEVEDEDRDDDEVGTSAA